MKFTASAKFFKEVSKIIPLASQTFSKSYLQYVPENSPLFITHGKGAYVWDVDGNKYLDFVNGLLPVVLGYQYKKVDEAVKDQLKKGITFSLPSPLEYQLAKKLTQLIPCAQMVRFGKNGSDATAGAVRLARAVTKRDRIASCGYHGWQDWYIGLNPKNAGVPQAVKNLVHKFEYNNIQSLEQLVKKYPGEFAAVIMEPMTFSKPQDRFLHRVKTIAHANGALLIFDEIITGFRFGLGGAQEYFRVIPDLATFGKSMANGM
ncbi:MAG: aminotransferase class III-fold pyridoxal phosphate-dependent enzyme, partial [Candidatus Wildermuthbacteria bacterium]|nr:aminotransferase class III-fold pyridoxal phosphate-dependent enzyme [Candidatus Wildermuthbacteria bacterium]